MNFTSGIFPSNWPYRGLKCRPIEVEYLFEVIRWQVASFQMIAGSSFIFFNPYKICCVFYVPQIKILISNWPRKLKFSKFLQAVEDMPVAFDFSHQGHALVTLYILFLCSDWSKFDRWVHAENLCSILKPVYFDRWSWQCFVSTCNVSVFVHWMYKMEFSCFQESSVIHG